MKRFLRAVPLAAELWRRVSSFVAAPLLEVRDLGASTVGGLGVAGAYMMLQSPIATRLVTLAPTQ